MRDWKVEVESRLRTLSVGPERQAEIVEELSLYLRDRYEELRAEGHSVQDADATLIAELVVRSSPS